MSVFYIERKEITLIFLRVFFNAIKVLKYNGYSKSL